ncbi:MAG: glycoside hydrolase family 15 protein [Chloroflexi bacterium]|nr:glycoside hydrolase family 15 protein [Chloroflexota bacterium]
MPRDLPIANGRLLVNFDSRYHVRDIYFPYAGQANHSYGCLSRLGVWVDGTFTWVSDEEWQLQLVYAEDTLVTRVTATNSKLDLVLDIEDAVDFNLDALIRRFEVHNLGARPREVRLFVHYDFAIWGTTVGNAAFYYPEARAVVAYSDRAYFLINTLTRGSVGVSSWTVGHKDVDDGRGSWHDAEDGELDRAPTAFGSIDCVAAMHMGRVPAGSSAEAYSWMAVGESLEEVAALDRQIVQRTPAALLQRTSDYWRAWANKETKEDSRFERLPASLREMYKRSLLIIRAQTARDGAIIAAADSNISSPYSMVDQEHRAPVYDPFHGHEHYSYMWPRDGALTAMALDRAGYGGVSRQFLAFCARVIHYDEARDHGYMLQRYHPSGSVASYVIPWVDTDGYPRLPVQEDESALVLVALWEHYSRTRDWEFITPLYRTVIKTIGNFLRDYRDPKTGLPLPSQELWEERDGIHAFTVATVWAGLQAAANFTELFGEHDLTRSYRAAADGVKKATEQYLYDEGEGRFVRTVQLRDGKVESPDPVVDASLMGLFYFGMFDVDDARIERTMEAVIRRLSVPTPAGGIARYEGDEYHRADRDGYPPVPGNPWFLCSLWIAQYHILKAKVLADLEPAREILEWAHRHALPSGVMSEQLDPYTGMPVSATPLTWSHATAVATIGEYMERLTELGG